MTFSQQSKDAHTVNYELVENISSRYDILVTLSIENYKKIGSSVDKSCFKAPKTLIFILISSAIPSLSSDEKLAVLFVGQVLVALGQPFATYAPAKTASTWFPEHQRAIATTIGAVCKSGNVFKK